MRGTTVKRDPLVEIEVGVRGDTAAALGQAGRKLQAALRALAAADRRGEIDPSGRRGLLAAAAYALWAYVVQREAVGLTDHARVIEAYGVSAEVWRRMGASS